MQQGVVVVKPGGHKGMDEFLCISKGVGGTELGDVLEMEKADSELFDVAFHSQVCVQPQTKFGHNR